MTKDELEVSLVSMLAGMQSETGDGVASLAVAGRMSALEAAKALMQTAPTMKWLAERLDTWAAEARLLGGDWGEARANGFEDIRKLVANGSNQG